MKRLFLLFILLFFSQSSFAARTFSFNGPTNLVNGPGEPSCSFVIGKLSSYKDVDCIGLDAAVKNAISSPNTSYTFTVNAVYKSDGSQLGRDGVGSITMVGGSCIAGTSAGTVEVPMFYTVNGEKVQTIRTASQVTGSIAGCKVNGVGTDGTGVCIGFPRAGTNATLMTCGVEMQETGQDGGAEGVTDSDPGYNGSLPGTGGGGGTNPGDGTNPGGDGSGGGDAAGGSGGGSGDGGTGGGGTGGDGGSGGGGGGGGDGGSGGGGDSRELNCGAPGQPACRIDEMGTPDGRDLFKDLLALVERAGVLRKAGLDDAVAEQGKDTGIRLFSLPTMSANCTDPRFDIVGRNFTVPICKYISMIGAGFEAFWAVAFVLAVMSMVSRAMNKPVS